MADKPIKQTKKPETKSIPKKEYTLKRRNDFGDGEGMRHPKDKIKLGAIAAAHYKSLNII